MADPLFTTLQNPATQYARRIFTEVARVDPRLHRVHHWRIDHRTWAIVRDIHTPGGCPLASSVIDPDVYPETGHRVFFTLVGFPVVFDDEHGESLRLVCNGGVRSPGRRDCPSCGGSHG